MCKHTLGSQWTIVAGLLLLSTPALAESPATRPLDVDGHPGIWYSVETAQRLLKDATRAKAAEVERDTLNKRLDVEIARTAKLDQDRKLLQQEVSTQQAALAEQQKHIADMSKWYHSASLWFGMGLGTGAVLATSIALAIALH